MFRVKFLDHNIPAIARPSSAVEARIRVLNASDDSWICDASDPHPVYLAAWINGVAVAAGFLPEPVLNSNCASIVQMRFSVPQEHGPFLLKLGMVQQNVALFEDEGAEVLVLKPCVAERLFAARQVAGVVPRYGFEVLDYRAPAKVRCGSRFSVWVRLRNTGSLLWEPHAAHNRLVTATVKIGEHTAGGAPVPHAVAPGEAADVHLLVSAPDQRACFRLHLNLVHENVAFFEAKGVQSFPIVVEIEGDQIPEESRLYNFALGRNSWFYQPTGGVTASLDGVKFPLLLKRAKGCHIWDLSGRRYIDSTMGWGSALLGHGFEPVQQAVQQALDLGVTLPLPHPLEIDVTQMLCDDIPCAEAVAFGKNGSDVCSLAVRLARVTTGRHVVLTCGYHGWQDWYAEMLGFHGSGVPGRAEGLVHRFPFNDIEAFRCLVHKYRDDLAAVMLEPSGPAGARPFGPGDDVDPVYLKQLAEETHRAGAILIFDEIITGFRYRNGGIQNATAVVPDLACLGKALANGMPLSAVVGRADLFRAMPQVFYGPTHKGELLSLAAAKAALSCYRANPVAEHVWHYGERLKDHIGRLCRQLDLSAEAVGPPFRFALVFLEKDPEKASLLLTLYMQELLKNGVMPYYGFMLPSYAHDEEAWSNTADAIERALTRVRSSDRAGTLHCDIEIPLVRVGQ